jgi:hypothetical protein
MAYWTSCGGGLVANQLVANAKLAHATGARPTTAADRENLKTAEFTRSLLGRTNGEQTDGYDDQAAAGQASPLGGSRKYEAYGYFASDALRDDISEVGHIIQSLKGGKQIDSRMGSRMDERVEEAEEERRRLQREQREKMKRNMKARDPKHKVAQKVESRRNYEAGTDGTSVPMVTVSVQGVRGPERIPLVDVHSIRSRCKRLSSTCSVESLLKDQQVRDEEERQEAQMLKEVKEDVPQGSLHLQLSFKERCLKARTQKRALHVGAMIHKIESMRSMCPEGVLERYTAKSSNSGFNQGQDGLESMRSSVQLTRQERIWNCDSTKSLKGLIEEEPARKSLLHSATSLCKTREKARRCWAIVRAFVIFFVQCLLLVKRRNAALMVQSVMRQLGEWSRVKLTMKLVIKDVRKIQGYCRGFLELKHHRCELIQKDWQRFEDVHLSKFYKMYQELIVAEAHQKAQDQRSRRPSRAGDIFDTSRSVKAPAINWKQFRIPPVYRKQVVGRFYMARLRRHVRAKANVVELFRSALERQRDMVKFLSSFGADTSNIGIGSTDEGIVRNAAAAPSSSRFLWRPTEEEVLNMIALAVQDLQCACVLPFRDHASRKDIKGNVMFRGDDQKLSLIRSQLLSSRVDNRMSIMPTAGEVEDVNAVNEYSSEPNDIDEVFDRFVPHYQTQLDEHP